RVYRLWRNYGGSKRLSGSNTNIPPARNASGVKVRLLGCRYAGDDQDRFEAREADEAGGRAAGVVDGFLLRVMNGGFWLVAGVAVEGGKLGGLEQGVVRDVLSVRILYNNVRAGIIGSMEPEIK